MTKSLGSWLNVSVHVSRGTNFATPVSGWLVLVEAFHYFHDISIVLVAHSPCCRKFEWTLPRLIFLDLYVNA